MKRMSLIAAVAMTAACVLAQGEPKPKGAPGRDGGHGAKPPLAPNSGIWVAKMLSKPEVIEKIGVTDEAAKAKIIGGLAELDGKGAKLEEEIRRLSLEQAGLFKSVLSDKEADAAPLYAKVDEIAALRTEQGKLAVEALVLLRDCLSQEQIDRAVKIVEERAERRFERRKPSPFEGERGKGRRKMRKGPGRHGRGADEARPECAPEGPADGHFREGGPVPPPEGGDGAGQADSED